MTERQTSRLTETHIKKSKQTEQVRGETEKNEKCGVETDRHILTENQTHRHPNRHTSHKKD